MTRLPKNHVLGCVAELTANSAHQVAQAAPLRTFARGTGHRLGRWLGPVGICALLAACGSKDLTGENSAKPPAAHTVAPVAEVREGLDLGRNIDADAMLASITWLAADERRGRYSLSPEIKESADWLAQQYRDIGVGPVGEDFSHPFAVLVGAEANAEPSLRRLDGRDRLAIAADDMAVRAEGSSGAPEGEVVFVGYAALGYRVDAQTGEETLAHDDLADIDVQGRIVLMLDGRPGRPDWRSNRRAIAAAQTAYEERLAKLGERYLKKGQDPKRADKDSRYARKRRAAEMEAREAVAQAFAQLLPRSAISDAYWQLEPDFEVLQRELTRQAKLAKELQYGWRNHRLNRKLARLKQAGAAGVLLVRGRHSLSKGDPEAEQPERLPKLADTGVVRSPSELPVLQLRQAAAQRLFRAHGFDLDAAQAKIDKSEAAASQDIAGLKLAMRTNFTRGHVEVPNVLAMIPGSDLADEYIVIGAHYDHIGDHVSGECHIREVAGKQDGICNGADDNASGTALLVELARTIKRVGYQPRRSIIFSHFAGEEMGLLGSKALVEDPPLDLHRVAAMVNVDMIGRMRADGLSISGLATSSGWRPLIERNGFEGLPVLLDAAITSRSDHAAFYKHEIPVVFFFTGVHEDYHQATDETDKLNLPGMAALSQIIARLVQDLGEGAAVPWTTPPEAHRLAPPLPGENEASILARIPGTVPGLAAESAETSP